MTGGNLHPELRATLMSALAERAPKVDRDRVAACFDFAATAHGAQTRESGEPYVSHPVEVCRILLDLLENRMDTTLACAACRYSETSRTGGAPIYRHSGRPC